MFINIFISENLVLSDIHKNAFSREPRVYDICQTENIETIRWKNSENYLENYNKTSYIKLVRYTKNMVYELCKKNGTHILREKMVKSTQKNLKISFLKSTVIKSKMRKI